MSDWHIAGGNLICDVHRWDYRLDTGISEYNNCEALPKFSSWVENGLVLVDEDEIAAWCNNTRSHTSESLAPWEISA